MTKSCQQRSFSLVVFCLFALLLFPASGVCAADEGRVSFADAPLAELQKDNVALRRQVQRLKQQVSAQREELNSPGLTEIAGGIGYIVGIFGLFGWKAARKQSSAGAI